jgi:hypothetical protein
MLFMGRAMAFVKDYKKLLPSVEFPDSLDITDYMEMHVLRILMLEAERAREGKSRHNCFFLEVSIMMARVQ